MGCVPSRGHRQAHCAPRPGSRSARRCPDVRGLRRALARWCLPAGARRNRRAADRRQVDDQRIALPVLRKIRGRAVGVDQLELVDGFRSRRRLLVDGRPDHLHAVRAAGRERQATGNDQRQTGREAGLHRATTPGAVSGAVTITRGCRATSLRGHDAGQRQRAPNVERSHHGPVSEYHTGHA